MVVADFDIVCTSLVPAETDAPLVIDTDGILPGTVAGKFFEPVARRAAQIADLGGGMEHQGLAFGLPGKGTELAGGLACGVELLGVFAGEGFDHDGTRYVSWIEAGCKGWVVR